jgi:hypothetical protein
MMFGRRAVSAEYAGEKSNIERIGTALTMISVAILCSNWPSKSWVEAPFNKGVRGNIDTSEQEKRQAAGRELQAAISALAAARSTFGWWKTHGKTP